MIFLNIINQCLTIVYCNLDSFFQIVHTIFFEIEDRLIYGQVWPPHLKYNLEVIFVSSNLSNFSE